MKTPRTMRRKVKTLIIKGKGWAQKLLLRSREEKTVREKTRGETLEGLSKQSGVYT